MATELRGSQITREYQAVCDTGDKFLGKFFKDEQSAQSELREHILSAHGGHIRTTTTVVATAATTVQDSDNGVLVLGSTTLDVPGVGKVEITFKP